MSVNLTDLGKTIIDRDGDKIGKLEDVYVDVETDEPMFATVKEGRELPCTGHAER